MVTLYIAPSHKIFIYNISPRLHDTVQGEEVRPVDISNREQSQCLGTEAIVNVSPVGPQI